MDTAQTLTLSLIGTVVNNVLVYAFGGAVIGGITGAALGETMTDDPVLCAGVTGIVSTVLLVSVHHIALSGDERLWIFATLVGAIALSVRYGYFLGTATEYKRHMRELHPDEWWKHQ